MSDAWPKPDELTSLFQRVRERDRLAVSDFLAAVLEPLLNHLRQWRNTADEHACLTAAEDAVLALIRDPAIYDPTQRGLRGFLCMAAQGDLLNALAKEAKHHKNRQSGDCVELAPESRNASADDLDDLPSFADPAVAAEIASFDATERAVFELMCGGERATAAYVPVLGIGHLSADEQARAVKRAKDRTIKRLQRAGGKS